MNKETIKFILNDFHEKSLPEAFDRSLELPLDLNKIVTLVGIRRSGKTYLLYRTMQRLIDNGVDKHNIIYINFEADRLFPVKLSEMDLILKAYHELYPDRLSEKNIFFWMKFSRYQTGKNMFGEFMIQNLFVSILPGLHQG